MTKNDFIADVASLSDAYINRANERELRLIVRSIRALAQEVLPPPKPANDNGEKPLF